jgi:hypothetical protein
VVIAGTVSFPFDDDWGAEWGAAASVAGFRVF